MFERLENILKKYEELKIELTKPEVLSDYNLLKKLSKEHSDLEEIVLKYTEYKNVEKGIEEAKSLLNDSEFREIAATELETLTEKIAELK